MRQPRVLVVDDDENILSAFKSFLKKERCAMIAATSAEEAMEQFKQHTIDILITDVRLKAQSGITFLLEIRRLYRHVPIIVITGYPEVVSESDARAFGADYFFSKPLDLEQFRKTLRTCFRWNHLPAETHQQHP